jgi:hypothetical protein
MKNIIKILIIGISAMSYAQEKDSLTIKVSGFLETYMRMILAVQQRI